MCSHYEGVRDAQVLRKVFQVEPPADLGKSDLWPGYPGLLIRRPREKDSGDDAVPDREALRGLFGLVPHWATDLKICRSTYNASGALLTVRSGKSACSHDLVTVSCGSGRSDCLNWRQRPSAEVRQGPVNDGSAANAVLGCWPFYSAVTSQSCLPEIRDVADPATAHESKAAVGFLRWEADYRL